MEIASIINPIHIMMGTGTMIINQSGFLFKKSTTKVSIGITNILKKVTEASPTVVIMGIHTGIKIMKIVTMGTGIPGETGKDIIELIRTDSIMGNIIMMMAAISYTGFATRMVAHAFSIPSEGNI